MNNNVIEEENEHVYKFILIIRLPQEKKTGKHSTTKTFYQLQTVLKAKLLDNYSKQRSLSRPRNENVRPFSVVKVMFGDVY